MKLKTNSRIRRNTVPEITNFSKKNLLFSFLPHQESFSSARPFSSKTASTNSNRSGKGGKRSTHKNKRGRRGGGEFSQLLSNLALSTNLMNGMARGTGGNTLHTAIALTLGRLLIVGQKAITLQKTAISQQSAYPTAKKHDTDWKAKVGKYSFNDTNTWKTYQEQKLGAFGDYAQTHANLPGEIPQRIRSTEPLRQEQSTNKERPVQPAPAHVPFRARLKPVGRINSKGRRKGKGKGSESEKWKGSEEKGKPKPENPSKKTRQEQTPWKRII